MARVLGKGGILSLNLYAGMVVAFKSDRLDLSSEPLGEGQETQLDLYNQNGDITLCIIFRRGHDKVFFNDRADKSLLNGWGQEQSVSLNPMDLDKWRSGITISVHDCSTRSSERYQILFNLTTVYNFEKRFLGPAIKVVYQERAPLFNHCPSLLSDSLRFFSYKLDDLPLVERQAIGSGKVLNLAIPAQGSTAISTRPLHFDPNQAYASISWDNGKEIRIYHLGPGNVLQDYIYSSRDRKGWHYGNLKNHNIVLNPSSSITVLRYRQHIDLLYQDPNTDVIKVLGQFDPAEPWRLLRQTITRAATGTSIAAVWYLDTNVNKYNHRVYYQDPELYLRECTFDRPTKQWVLGSFNPGIQPLGTPITAEIVHGGDVDINVMWRDAHGRAVSSSWSTSSGWDLPNDESRLLDGRD